MNKCKYKCSSQNTGGFTDQHVMMNMLNFNNQHLSILKDNVLFKAKLTVALMQCGH